MKSWIDQLRPIIKEYKDGDDSPLTPEEVERIALIIRFKIDKEEGNISAEDIESAMDEVIYEQSTRH
jgi:hypothetical protein